MFIYVYTDWENDGETKSAVRCRYCGTLLTSVERFFFKQYLSLSLFFWRFKMTAESSIIIIIIKNSSNGNN
jgi:hypothetical protein